jgi:hypothetical protein
VLFKALKDLDKDCIEMAWCDRIEQRADLIITGNLLDPQQSLHVIVPFGLLQPALIVQERRGLGEKDAKGAQGSILDSVSGVGSLLAMVRQWRDPSVQDALEDLEA